MARIKVNIVKEQDIKIHLERRGVAGSSGLSGSDGTSGTSGFGTSGTSVVLLWGTDGTIGTNGYPLGTIYMQIKGS